MDDKGDVAKAALELPAFLVCLVLVLPFVLPFDGMRRLMAYRLLGLLQRVGFDLKDLPPDAMLSDGEPDPVMGALLLASLLAWYGALRLVLH